MSSKYEVPSAGGSWEHRSGDCPEHGVNIAFARPYKTRERYQCCACMLECAALLLRRDEGAARG